MIHGNENECSSASVEEEVSPVVIGSEARPGASFDRVLKTEECLLLASKSASLESDCVFKQEESGLGKSLSSEIWTFSAMVRASCKMSSLTIKGLGVSLRGVLF